MPTVVMLSPAVSYYGTKQFSRKLYNIIYLSLFQVYYYLYCLLTFITITQL